MPRNTTSPASVRPASAASPDGPFARPFARWWRPGSVLDAMVWLMIVACAAVVVSVAAGWVITPRLVAAQALLPVVAGGAMVASAIAVVRRRRPGMAVGTALGVVVSRWALALVVPTTMVESRPAWSAASPTFTVYSANLRRTNTEPSAAFAAAFASDADVVVFVEYARAFEPTLRESGLLDRYPTVVRDEAHDLGLLLTRLPVDGSGVLTDAGFEMPAANVVVGSTEVLVSAVHATSPAQRAYLDRWESQVPGIARAVDGFDNVVAIGDFNSSLWNPPMRQLLDWGFTDAHAATGNGLARTWGPAPTGTTATVPVLGIDHALSRGADLVPLSVDEGRIPGSDHRSIEVTYAVR